MASWEYSLESEGKELRRLIGNQEKNMKNIVAIYNQIVTCLESLKKNLEESDRENWEYDIKSMIDDLKCACPDLNDESLEYYEEEETLNSYLSDFYDLCDAARVWIEIS